MEGVNNMKLVVGLGNPGKEYEKTRHNIGFMFLDYCFDSDKFTLNKKFNALEYETIINSQKVLLIKPLSFMNLSGEVVGKYVKYYDIASSDILIIQDDIDLKIGSYKFQYNHGDGGHNGIKNIILNLGSKEFLRLKIGVSKNEKIDTKKYVLGRLNKSEMTLINENFIKLKDVISDFTYLDNDRLMCKYNTKIQGE